MKSRVSCPKIMKNFKTTKALHWNKKKHRACWVWGAGGLHGWQAGEAGPDQRSWWNESVLTSSQTYRPDFWFPPWLLAKNSPHEKEERQEVTKLLTTGSFPPLDFVAEENNSFPLSVMEGVDFYSWASLAYHPEVFATLLPGNTNRKTITLNSDCYIPNNDQQFLDIIKCLMNSQISKKVTVFLKTDHIS